MKTMALLDKDGVCINLALWDGVAAWDPVGTLGCAAVVDATGQAGARIGATYAAATGTWTAPPDVPAPDPAGFLRAAFADPAIPAAARLALVPWRAALAAGLDWPDRLADLAAQVDALTLPAAARKALADHAGRHDIPGVTP